MTQLSRTLFPESNGKASTAVVNPSAGDRGGVICLGHGLSGLYLYSQGPRSKNVTSTWVLAL